MNKFIKSLLLITLSIISAFCFIACGDEDDDDTTPPTPPAQVNKFEYNDKGDYIEITGIRIIYQSDVVVPDQIDGKPVTTIADNAFNSDNKITNNKLTSIALGNNLTTIGKTAFKSCTKLTSITNTENLTTIGEGAFENCTALTDFELSGKVSIIEKKVFSNCKALASINLTGVLAVYENAFVNCGLTANQFTVTGSQGLANIGPTAFMGCALNTIELSTALTKLDIGAFTQSYLTSISIPSTITKITTNVFDGCSKLASVTLSSGLTEISSHAFRNCAVLDNLVLPNTLTKIDAEAFYSCGALSSITIPNGISRIEARTFVGCSSLREIIIGSGVKYIGEHAFGDGSDDLSTPQIITSFEFRSMVEWKCYSGSSEVAAFSVIDIEDPTIFAKSYWDYRNLVWKR